MGFERIDLNYVPKDIGIEEFLEANSVELASSETEASIDKLLQHAKIIKDWRDRIDSIRYLQDKAATLAGNPVFITTEQDIARAVEALGGKNGTIDFAMFKQSIDIVLEGYRQMALVAITGAM